MTNVERLKEKIQYGILNDPNFGAAWLKAEAAVRADGVDTAKTPFELLLPMIASKDEEFSGLLEILESCVKQDEQNASAPTKKRTKSPDELVGPGAPLLVTGSGPKASQFSKELAWKRGVDPEVVEADLFPDDDASVEAVFRATSLGSFVIVEGLESCDESVRKTVLGLSKDKDRTVVVAVRGKDAPPEFPPSEFAHWARFP